MQDEQKDELNPMWNVAMTAPNGSIVDVLVHNAQTPADKHADSQEAQRARRRHRRRIARIVVDHWKSFARERLLLLAAARHHARKLLLAGYYALQSNVSRERALWRRACIFDVRRSFLALSQLLGGWASAVRWRKEARLRVAHLQRVAAVGRLRQSLAAWRGAVQSSHLSHKQLMQAHYYHAYTVVTKSLHRWRLHASHAAHKRRRRALGLRFWARGQLRRALLAWREAAALQRAVQQLHLAAATFQHASYSKRAWVGWRGEVHWAQQARLRLHQACVALDLQLLRGTVAAALALWQQRLGRRRTASLLARTLSLRRQLAALAWYGQRSLRVCLGG
jgi:hypothetical protein